MWPKEQDLNFANNGQDNELLPEENDYEVGDE